MNNELQKQSEMKLSPDSIKAIDKAQKTSWARMNKAIHEKTMPFLRRLGPKQLATVATLMVIASAGCNNVENPNFPPPSASTP